MAATQWYLCFTTPTDSSWAGNQNLHEIARLDSSHHLSDTVSKLVELPVSANKKAGLMTSDQPQIFEMKTRTFLTNTTVEWTTPCFGFVANFRSLVIFKTFSKIKIKDFGEILR